MRRVRLHECAAPECGQMVGLKLLMCIGHWRQVSADIRRQVVTTWQAWNAGTGELEPYLRAREAAIGSVTP